MTLSEVAVLCRALEETLNMREPWMNRIISCGLGLDTCSVLVVVFGAWLPTDFVPVMAMAQNIILEGECDESSSHCGDAGDQSVADLRDLIRQARDGHTPDPGDAFS
jgi:hypothetical protein